MYCDGAPLECDGAPAESAQLVEPAQAPALAVTWSKQTQRLMVDLSPSAGTAVSQAWLFAGELDVEPFGLQTPPVIRPSHNDSSVVKSVLQGGKDATRPLEFKDVEPGIYTVCGQVGARDVDWRWSPLSCAHVTVADEVETRAVLSG